MKFKRNLIIQAIDKEISRREQAADAEYDRQLQKYAEARDEWMKDWKDWSKFAETIHRRIGAGQPVTAEDVPDSIVRHRSYLEVFSSTAPERKPALIQNLNQLRAMVVLSEDELVSLSELSRAGFKDLSIFG